MNIYKLIANNKYIVKLEENVMENDNIMEPANTEVDNIDKQFFAIRLNINITIKSLVILTIYNWQSIDITDSFAFLTFSHISNSIRHIVNNREFSTLYY